MPRKTKELKYDKVIACDEKALSKELGLPLKVIKVWKDEWLSFPVSEEDFRILSVIVNYVWKRDTLVKAQIAQKTQSEKERFIRDAGLPRPIAWLRNWTLQRQLKGEKNLSSKSMNAVIKKIFPKGYRLVTHEEILKARRWAKDQREKYKDDPAGLSKLAGSINLIEDIEVINGDIVAIWKQKRKSDRKPKSDVQAANATEEGSAILVSETAPQETPGDVQTDKIKRKRRRKKKTNTSFAEGVK